MKKRIYKKLKNRQFYKHYKDYNSQYPNVIIKEIDNSSFTFTDEDFHIANTYFDSLFNKLLMGEQL